MSPVKGDRTRRTILAEAHQLASVVGLEGLSIGTLASRLGLSKSGLFAHFGSKEALQLAVIETGVAHYMETVVEPSMALPTGIERARALFEGWIHWSTEEMAGGCLFVTAAVEFDDRPGPVRDQLAKLHHRWLGVISSAAEMAMRSGDFRPDLDLDQFAYDFHAILLGFNQARRLVRDPEARTKAKRSLDRLLRDASAAVP